MTPDNNQIVFDFRRSTILVTGATGHTGRRLVQSLLGRGARVRCLVHSPANEARLPAGERRETVLGSADSVEDLLRACEGVDAVVNLAHIRYAPALLEALARRGKPARLIATSSTRAMSVYPTPIREVVRESEAAFAKAAPGIEWTVLRPSMIFGGPDDNNIERLARLLRKTPVFPLFSGGENLVQPIFVWDLVAAIEACLERPETAGRVYVVAGPEPVPYRRMVEMVARAAGLKPPLFVRLPRGVCAALAAALKFVWRRSPLDPEAVRRFGEDRSFDISDARREFGFAPIPFEEALGKKFRGEA